MKKFKLSFIDILFIILFSFITYISFIVNNSLIYLLIGILCLVFFMHKIAKSTSYILSLFFLLYHPFSLTLGQTGIPFLGASSILLIYIFTFTKIIKYRNRGKFKIGYKLFSDLAILGLGTFLLIKWIISGFSFDGFQQTYMFYLFGVIPYISFSYLNLSKINFYDSIYVSQKFYISYLISFCLLCATKSNYIEIVHNIENPIGLSFFFLSNGLLSLIYYKHNRLISMFVIFISICLLLIIGQRSYMLGLAIYCIIIFSLSNISRVYKIIIFVLLLMVINSVYLLLPEDLGYKLNYFLVFFNDIEGYFDKIYSYGSELHDEIGTIGTRLFLWYTVLIKTNIYIGNNLGSFMLLTGYSYPHNIILEFYYIFGLLGLFAILTCIFKVLKLCLSKNMLFSNASPFCAILIILLVVLNFSSSIAGLFTNVLLYYKILNIHYSLHHEKKTLNYK